jgi:FAD/FMN-containing dehydrogenase
MTPLRRGLLRCVVRVCVVHAVLVLATSALLSTAKPPQSSSSTCNSSLGLHFYSWDGQQHAEPVSYVLPRSEAELAAVLARARADGETVKVIGGGLSFSGVQMVQGGHLVSLDRMATCVVNTTYPPELAGGALVDVQPGCRVRNLVEALAALEMPQTMLNLGATATQSIAGATATSTHGTGAAIGSLATQIHALRIMDAAGVTHAASNDTNPALFRAARVGIGALGIVTSLTLRTYPLFKLRRYTLPFYNLTELLDELPRLMAAHPRLQWSWTPYTDNASVLIRDEVPWDTPVSPPDGGCWSDALGANDECVDVAYKALTDSWAHYFNRSLYTEMEMFFPANLSTAAVCEFVRVMDTLRPQHDPSVVLHTMLRYVAADDDILLSPMAGRDTAVMSIIVQGADQTHTGSPAEFAMYSAALENLTAHAPYLSRPHWGKVNYFTQDQIRRTYGDAAVDAFLQQRDLMDPPTPFRLFGNDYLLQRLGA